MNISEFCKNILLGVIGNAIFAIIVIYVVQQLRYCYYLKRKFHNRQFETFNKRFPDDIVFVLTCRVKENIISFTGSKADGSDAFEGEFIINIINLKTGDGFHWHIDSNALNLIAL